MKEMERVDGLLITRSENDPHSFWVLFGLNGEEKEYGLLNNWLWSDINHIL